MKRKAAPQDDTVVTYTYKPNQPSIFSPSSFSDESKDCSDMTDSVIAVEKLLNYRFTNKKLLEEALTHSSYTESTSYQRLEFVGDAVLGLAISNHVYLAYPDLDPGQLSLIRAANISTEKLARVAVNHGLYHYVRHNTSALDKKVTNFVKMVQQEGEDVEVYGGLTKAPKVLADIVESVAAAIYIDCGYDLMKLWVIFRRLLEPIMTPKELKQQPQPVTMLFELCQKEGKQLKFEHLRKDEKNIASVFIDGDFVVSCSAEHKENARLNSAKAALEKLSHKITDKMGIDFVLDEKNEIQSAKQKLNELSGKKKWPKPTYGIEKEIGRSHERRYICWVKITTSNGVLVAKGDEKSRIRDSENSAASIMLLSLQQSKLI